MATEFTPLNANDTRELRKEIGLPVTKDLVYWYKTESYTWRQANVINYEVIETLVPSGSKCLRITLDDGKKVCILGDYLSDMQKISFLKEIEGNTEIQGDISGKCGERVERILDSYIVIDLETTGSNHLIDEITEIGAIKYEAGKEVGRFNVLVKTDVEISKIVEKKTGISNDMLYMFGVEPREALEELKAFLADSVVVGHNFTTFDSKFLEDAYTKVLKCHFPNDYVDTLYLARENLPNLKHHNLECLSKEFNIDYSKAHRAIEDCVINHLVYEYLTYGSLLNDEGDDFFVLNDSREIISSKNYESFEKNDEELVEVDVIEEWQVKLTSLFDNIEKKNGLMKHSFSIMANKGKSGEVSSYAVCVYEPDLVEDRRDSSRNTVLARVKENILKSNPNIVEVYSKSFKETDEKKRFEKDSTEFIECLVDCIKKGILDYTPKAAGFACCSRYQECSKAKKCIHPNLLYAKACQYLKNLEDGNVFY
ncbi:MAG: 3'-5' exonuclease [Lachnospiraceae bacterium]|nr:3'-5' exonuclease [Lachnospiraceae bacterium]